MKNFISRRIIIISFIISLVAVAFLFSFLPIMVRGSNGETYWPTFEWNEVTPESQGSNINF